jgi:hypothetical protein
MQCATGAAYPDAHQLASAYHLSRRQLTNLPAEPVDFLSRGTRSQIGLAPPAVVISAKGVTQEVKRLVRQAAHPRFRLVHRQLQPTDSRQSPECRSRLTLTLNQGPFPPPALPGFAGTTDLSLPQAARPVARGHPVEGHAPSPHGLPVLRSISVCRHAVVNTPVARWVGSLVGRPIPTVSLLASGYGLPQTGAGSAHTLHWTFRGLLDIHLRDGLPARCIAKRHICLEGSDGFVSSPRRFDSFRLERTSCRVLHPLKTNTFFTAHPGFRPLEQY